MKQNKLSPAAITPQQAQQSSGRWKLFAVFAVCAFPLIASYFTYYVIKPQARTNYGDFIDYMVHPIPADLNSTALDGKPVALKEYEGKWIMLQVDGGACAEPCSKKLYDMRQLRLTQGRERDRVERVWLITDKAPLDTLLMREFDGTRLLRVDAAAVARWLPVEAGGNAADHIYLIDPLGRLMMRFPKDRDPNLIKKDLGKLLKASSIG
ncbi:cytochrome C oxidase subunit I [Actimicrobium antarcticum]|uniref:Cytochrome c oxidase subunit I n=1 Tax=Actimicrobium antarcticum TaxID=1051899 RepID=A0ABP7T8V3_9BURK